VTAERAILVAGDVVFTCLVAWILARDIVARFTKKK